MTEIALHSEDCCIRARVGELCQFFQLRSDAEAWIIKQLKERLANETIDTHLLFNREAEINCILDSLDMDNEFYKPDKEIPEDTARYTLVLYPTDGMFLAQCFGLSLYFRKRADAVEWITRELEDLYQDEALDKLYSGRSAYEQANKDPETEILNLSKEAKGFVCHRLLNLLAIALGNLELLARTIHVPGASEKFERIERACHRLNDAIRYLFNTDTSGGIG